MYFLISGLEGLKLPDSQVKRVQYKPSMTQAMADVKIGDDDLTVSVNETGTYFRLIREHTIAPNLLAERVSTNWFGLGT